MKLRVVALTWFLAGVGVGVFLAWRTVSMNDSIRTAWDALVLTAWIAAGYGIFMMIAGVIIRVFAGIISRSAGWPPVYVAVQLPAAVVFFVASALAYTIARDDRFWPDSAALKLIVIMLVFCAGWLVSRLLCGMLNSARPSRGASGIVATLFVVAIVVLASSSSAIGASRAEPTGSSMVSIPRAAPDRRVILLGLDGVEWAMLDRLIAEGRLPNFARLCESSAKARTLTLWPTYSPIIWTTIATGVSESKHGVQDFTELHIPGMSRGVQRFHTRPTHLPANVGLIEAVRMLVRWDVIGLSPIGARHRRAKALWNIASEAGASASVVSWYATYPAEVVNGFLVSDRNTTSFRGDTYAPLEGAPGLMFPDSIAGELGEAANVYPRPDASSILNHPSRKSLKGPPVKSEEESINREIEVDHYAASAALWLYQNYDVDLTMVYMPGTDGVSHIFGKHYAFVIERYYAYVDDWLGRFMDAADEQTVLIVVSDHGWSYNPKNLGHNHAPDGVLIAAGPGVSNGELSRKPAVADIAPTVLALLGIAVARDLDGRVIDEMLTDDVVVTSIDTYGAYLAPEPVDLSESELKGPDSEAIERLKNLGYIGD